MTGEWAHRAGTLDRLLAADVGLATLTRRVEAGTWVEGGWPDALTEPLTRIGDTVIALWEVSPGVVADVEEDEVVLVVAGAGSVAFSDGTVLELGPGAAIRLGAGEHVEWTIRERLRVFTVSVRPPGSGGGFEHDHRQCCEGAAERRRW